MRRSLILFCFVTHFALAQEKIEETKKKLTLKGYLKDMPSVSNYGNGSLFQNLIHNRLNFAWYPNQYFTVVAEFRTRIFVGDFVRTIPNYKDYIDVNNDFFTLSVNPIDNQSVLVNIMADRLYGQWSKANWEIKVGRQRINWGKNLAWNPNDWFNAYSFFDFDYEERPGSDAVRVSRYTGELSSVEVAAKMAKDIDHFVGAGMWKFNRWNYDFQLLSGLAQGDAALGTRWAGNLKSAGFKGEITYFRKVRNTIFNEAYQDMVLGAITIDYSLSKAYFNGSVMYNSQGSYHPSIGSMVIGIRPGTVRNLSPYVWSSFLQSTYQISPLLNSGIAIIAYPGTPDFFINPSLTISAKQNLDIDIIAQLFYGEDQSGSFGSLIKAAYVRIKWSF